MIEIRLKLDDPRVGLYDTDGAIEKWPLTDVLGREDYVREHMTIQHVPDGFVCIPPDRGKDIVIIDVLPNDTSEG